MATKLLHNCSSSGCIRLLFLHRKTERVSLQYCLIFFFTAFVKSLIYIFFFHASSYYSCVLTSFMRSYLFYACIPHSCAHSFIFISILLCIHFPFILFYSYLLHLTYNRKIRSIWPCFRMICSDISN